ncbi:hypothetical protein SteCoe_13279 [Stentor coeruleus]|uniref:Uncharacterized protein n=1 Tax=Stentor coeruleus TaxID=5963 RepID=A0A1R2C8W1_9CILI|nr:hypothetical protein SteCoe_13279 [Stentor coeruleus]
MENIIEFRIEYVEEEDRILQVVFDYLGFERMVTEDNYSFKDLKNLPNHTDKPKESPKSQSKISNPNPGQFSQSPQPKHLENEDEKINKEIQRLLDLENKLQMLQQENHELISKSKQKDEKIELLNFKLHENSAKNSEDLIEKINFLSSQLNEKIKIIENQTQTLDENTTKINDLTNALEQKSLQCQKLTKTMNDMKNNRKTAEVLLEKQEHMNKDLIERTVKYEKIIQDNEKKLTESLKVIKKLKDEIQANGEIMKQRDDQIKGVIKKVRILENDRNKLMDELKRRDDAIKTFQSSKQDKPIFIEKTLSPQLRHVGSNNELKKAMELIVEKDNEIKIMKDMIKSFQVKQQRIQISNNIAKNAKLPPITNSEKRTKSKHIQFKDPSQSSLKSLQDHGSFKKIRQDTPQMPKNIFKGQEIFPEGRDTEFSPTLISNSETPTDIKNLKDIKTFIDIIDPKDQISERKSDKSDFYEERQKRPKKIIKQNSGQAAFETSNKTPPPEAIKKIESDKKNDFSYKVQDEKIEPNEFLTLEQQIITEKNQKIDEVKVPYIVSENYENDYEEYHENIEEKKEGENLDEKYEKFMDDYKKRYELVENMNEKNRGEMIVDDYISNPKDDIKSIEDNINPIDVEEGKDKDFENKDNEIVDKKEGGDGKGKEGMGAGGEDKREGVKKTVEFEEENQFLDDFEEIS